MAGEGTSRGDELRRRGERLRTAVDALGSRRVADEAGVPYTTLRGYMAGGDMKLSVLAAVARACSITIDWIAYGRDADPDGPAPDDPAAAATSTTALAGSPDLHRLAVRLALQPADLVAFAAFGDAMEPAIRDGDILVAQRLERARIMPAVYAIESDGGLVARRIEQRVDGTLVVSTDNPRYERQVIEPGGNRSFRVLGPVVWFSGPLRS